MGDTPNLFEVPDNIVAIATLKKVQVSDGQRYLCCAFEMKRAHLKTVRKKPLSGITKLCPTLQPRTVPVTRAVRSESTQGRVVLGRAGYIAKDVVSRPPSVTTGRDMLFNGFGARKNGERTNPGFLPVDGIPTGMPYT